MTLPIHGCIRPVRYGLLLALACAAGGAGASSQLALAQGCFSCHGSLPRGDAPTFPQLAARYAHYQEVPEAEVMLAERLREPHRFGSISAHERISEESARALMRWIIQGAK